MTARAEAAYTAPMIQSMTGFGAGRAKVGDEEISVEIRSVNHKFCEVKARLPAELAAGEADLARQIKEAVRRGALEVSVKRSPGRASVVPRVDLELARAYVSAVAEAARELGLAQNLGAAELAQVEGLVSLEARALDLASAREAQRLAAQEALRALHAMREKEGASLAQDLLARVQALREGARVLASLSPKSVEDYRKRLAERIAELSRGVAVDPQRLAQEVALFADRVDIAEELTRLASHLDQLEAMVHSSEPAGRRMDFLVQEIHREVNTAGSKSQSAEIAQRIVALKAEVERIREQVQNVE